MEINDWIKTTCNIMQVRINKEELAAIAEMYKMFQIGTAEVNCLELGELDPTITINSKGWHDNE